MQKKILSLGLISLLTACGSGGGSSGHDKDHQSQSKQNLTSSVTHNMSKNQNTQSQGETQGNMPNQKAPMAPEMTIPAPMQPNNQMSKETSADNAAHAKFYTTGLDSVMKNGDPLTLTIDVYEENQNKKYQDDHDFIRKQQPDIVKLEPENTKIVKTTNTTEGNYYYFVPLGKFKTGYVGYYQYNQNGDGRTLTSKYVRAINENNRDRNVSSELTADFKEKNGFMYSPLNNSYQTERIVKFGDMELSFKKGHATGKVLDPNIKNDTLFNINGDTKNLVFTATSGQEALGIKAGAKGSSAHDDLTFVKDDNNQLKYVTGTVTGEFNGAFVVEKK